MSDSFPRLETDGWITIRVDQLDLPSVCAGCCGRATSTLKVQTETADLIASLLIPAPGALAHFVWVRVPYCKCCIASQFRSGVRGAILGLTLGLCFAGWLWYHKDDALILIPVFGVLGCVFGFIFGKKIGSPNFVQLKDYSERKRTLKVRFSNHEYQQRYLKSIGQS